jgi:hypothetical protein
MMNKNWRILLAILTLTFSCVIASVAVGQNRNVRLDPAFSAFWIKFKDAIAKNDKQRVADMTKLPFMMNSIDHDRAGFIKEYPKLFTLRLRRCIARAKPMKEQDYYEIFCGDQIFLFGKVDGVWKFVEIGVND